MSKENRHPSTVQAPPSGPYSYSLGGEEYACAMLLFLHRIFKINQSKRWAIPNGPKVGSGGSVSPRGDWRAPSDSEPEVWLKELRENVPD
jgi:hypothetical protein